MDSTGHVFMDQADQFVVARFGKATLKVCPFTKGGVDTQAEPSKVEPLGENMRGTPGGKAAHPDVKGPRVCPVVRRSRCEFRLLRKSK
jgi:hypothetical protein